MDGTKDQKEENTGFKLWYTDVHGFQNFQSHVNFIA
jgi:hypothetical protein